MSVVEGAGPFICTDASHKATPFKTTDLTEYNKHLATAGHKVSGRAPCRICGAQVILKGADTTKPTQLVCDKCKGEMK